MHVSLEAWPGEDNICTVRAGGKVAYVYVDDFNINKLFTGYEKVLLAQSVLGVRSVLILNHLLERPITRWAGPVCLEMEQVPFTRKRNKSNNDTRSNSDCSCSALVQTTEPTIEIDTVLKRGNSGFLSFSSCQNEFSKLMQFVSHFSDSSSKLSTMSTFIHSPASQVLR